MNRSTISQTVLISVFLIVIGLPFLDIFLHIAPKSALMENRNLATLPVVRLERKELEAFPTKFESYFNDNFGFRSSLVRGYNAAKMSWFGAFPSRQVTVGKEGWYFLAWDGFTDDYRGKDHFPVEQIERWQRDFQAKQSYLAARGIKYLVVVVPNKQSVYPEYLPEAVQRVRDATVFDRFLTQLQSGLDVPILDLRPLLMEAKTQGRIYDRTDSHWNELGALIAVNGIIARIQQWFPDVKPLPLSQYKQEIETGEGGDLARMLGFQDKIREDRIKLTSSIPVCSKPAGIRLSPTHEWTPDKMPSARECAQGDRSRIAVLTCDSFGTNLIPFFAEAFHRTVSLAPTFPYKSSFEEVIPEVVELEHPDVFVEELVERNFGHVPEALPTSLLGK